MTVALQLSIVIPVHDEAPSIAPSIRSWHATLAAHGISAAIIVIDDGSTDGTGSIVEGLGLDNVTVVRQANAGHGAAVLAGYRLASTPLVLQVDGDDEIGAAQFQALWAARSEAALVLGCREPTTRPVVRRVITTLAGLWLRVLTGRSVRDPNVPYRLVPRALLLSVLEAIPPQTFAPNLAMTLHALRHGWQVTSVPVVEQPRPQRRALGGLRLWQGVARAVRDTATSARRHRRL